MKIEAMVAAVAGASITVLTACTVATPDSGEQIGTSSQAEECHNPDGYYWMLAALANAVAIELREWEATKYFYNNGWRDMRINEQAKQRCLANGKDLCGNIQAILDMQNRDYLYNPEGQRIFDGVQFYQQMQVYLDRQRIWEGRTGANSCGPRPHTATLIAVDPGICALDMTYSIESEVDPANLICKLKFAGWPENTFLHFRSTDSTITLDPGGGMIEDEPSQNPYCQTSYLVYDPDGSEEGEPCCPDGFMGGTLARASWNDDTLVCTW